MIIISTLPSGVTVGFGVTMIMGPEGAMVGLGVDIGSIGLAVGAAEESDAESGSSSGSGLSAGNDASSEGIPDPCTP